VTFQSIPDVDHVAEILRDVAATIVVPRFRTLAPDEIRAKSAPDDLVTVADVASEAALTARLSDLVPGSLVVGEEAASADSAVFDRLRGDDRLVWIIDPIDGTHNFAHGDPEFGLMVAASRAGTTVAAWILAPMDGRMAIAVKGGGATINGEPVRPERPERLGDVVGAVSRRYCSDASRDQIETRSAAFKEARVTRCAAHDYLRILEGRSHIGYYNRVMPWDHAAGSLLVVEAGGHSAFVDGDVYSPRRREGGLLTASSIEVWTMARDQLFG